MAVEIKVPELGESVVEATVARWLVNEGDTVQAGDPVVELETDKVDLEVAAESSGILASIAVQAGSDVEIGDVLGTIDAQGAGTEPAESPENEESEETEASSDQEAAQGQAKQESQGSTASDDRATPVARRMAEEQGVDLAAVAGSGSRGRVTKEDVERHVQTGSQQPGAQDQRPSTPAAEPSEQSAAREGQPLFARPDSRREERVRLSRRRRTIAARLVEAQRTAAMLTTFNDIDMSAVMDLRRRRRDSFEKETGVRLGFMSFFTKAAIGALKAFPEINAEMDGDEMILKHYYDIGIAVGAEEGLVVPILRDADQMSFAQIEQTIRDLAQKAQAGTLALSDLQGGTFTITNGGVFGSMLSTPILNPPQVGILGLHRIEERPVVMDGEIVIRPMMYVALSYDHRIVDGKEAVQFLVKIKELIEEPERLLLAG